MCFLFVPAAFSLFSHSPSQHHPTSHRLGSGLTHHPKLWLLLIGWGASLRHPVRGWDRRESHGGVGREKKRGLWAFSPSCPSLQCLPRVPRAEQERSSSEWERRRESGRREGKKDRICSRARGEREGGRSSKSQRGTLRPPIADLAGADAMSWGKAILEGGRSIQHEISSLKGTPPSLPRFPTMHLCHQGALHANLSSAAS